MGGLSRKESKIHDIELNNGSRPILVDSGNLLFKKTGPVQPGSVDAINAEIIGAVYAAMKLDAMGIGHLDLSAGLDYLLKVQEMGVPWVSANIYDNDNNRIFIPYRLISRGGFKIAFVAVTGTNSQSKEFIIKNADNELSALLPEIEKSADIIILLSSLPFQQTVDTTQRFQQIDIAFTADRAKGNLHPQHSGNAIICQTSSRGQYLGVLEVIFRGHPWLKNNAQETAKLKRQLNSIDMQMKQINSLPPQPKAEKSAVLEKSRQQVQNRIKELEIQTTTINLNKYNTYNSKFLPLSASVRKDPEIEGIVRTARQKIKEAGQPHQKRPGS